MIEVNNFEDTLLQEPVATYNQLGLEIFNYVGLRKLEPIIKWAGGKEQEFKYIIPNLPDKFEDYYEPFVGGGSVYTALQANKYYINDKSEELIGLYRSIISKERNSFFEILEEIIHNWNLLTTIIQNNSTFFEKHKPSKFNIHELC